MSHDCVTRINAALAKKNSQLSPVIAFGGSELIQITTSKLDPKKKGSRLPVAVFASFCPFCGVQLERVKEVIS